MNVKDEIVSALSETKKSRLTLYLNERRVKQLYDQSIREIEQLVEQLVVTKELGEKLGGGIKTFVSFGGEVAEKEGYAAQLRFSPELMAVLLEYRTKRDARLLDPSLDEPIQDDALIRYVGASHIISHQKDVDAVETGWTTALAQVVQRERIRVQDEAKDLYDKEARTMVWVASPNAKRKLASIGFLRNVDPGNYISYSPLEHFGILGRFTREIEGVMFVSPLWIWHE